MRYAVAAKQSLMPRLVRAVEATPPPRPRPARSKRHTGRAKTLSPAQLDHLLGLVQRTARAPRRDRVIILLSFKAGLRACEIVGLNWRDVIGADGRVGERRGADTFFEVPNGIAKNSMGRSIPLHPELLAALEELHQSLPAELTAGNAPVVASLIGGRQSPNALVQHLKRLYRLAGLTGCSSHSGRRTLLTTLARSANEHNCSLYDVQDIAGHTDIASTEPYIEPGANVGAMVRAA